MTIKERIGLYKEIIKRLEKKDVIIMITILIVNAVILILWFMFYFSIALETYRDITIFVVTTFNSIIVNMLIKIKKEWKEIEKELKQKFENQRKKVKVRKIQNENKKIYKIYIISE